MISEKELFVDYEMLNFQEEMLNIQVDFKHYAIWSEILLIGRQKVSNIITSKANHAQMQEQLKCICKMEKQ